MRLTILGAGAACPPGGQNSSGYLVEDQGHTLLLDCGHGVASALLARRPAFDVQDILISHLHIDHFIDIVALRFRLSRDLDGLRHPTVRLHLPPGGRGRLRQMMTAGEFPPDFLETAFVVQEYSAAAPLRLGPLTVRIAEAVHYVRAYGMRVEGSATLAYSGDTAPCDSVVALARDADVFLCEATLAEPEHGAVKGHCTAAQAAIMARQANARALLLTHYWFDADLAAWEAAARREFRGPVAIARDGLVLDLRHQA